MTADRRAELTRVVDAAQRAAGILAARDRGDHAGAAALLRTFTDPELLAGGCLLVAELAVKQCGQASDRPVQACLQELSLDMELVLDA